MRSKSLSVHHLRSFFSLLRERSLFLLLCHGVFPVRDSSLGRWFSMVLISQVAVLPNLLQQVIPMGKRVFPKEGAPCHQCMESLVHRVQSFKARLLWFGSSSPLCLGLPPDHSFFSIHQLQHKHLFSWVASGSLHPLWTSCITRGQFVSPQSSLQLGEESQFQQLEHLLLFLSFFLLTLVPLCCLLSRLHFFLFL